MCASMSHIFCLSFIDISRLFKGISNFSVFFWQAFGKGSFHTYAGLSDTGNARDTKWCRTKFVNSSFSPAPNLSVMIKWELF